ncbi:SigE family RNA polymerase sigma factor [Streptomyces enissocaesilis]|uniref:RNA polymerase sigma-70 region 2 domain-containing protein n=1 Tax=Streptomyces enissocaesilis TaxID=332589 RepID=A0ABN3XEC2_9ACTN
MPGSPAGFLPPAALEGGDGPRARAGEGGTARRDEEALHAFAGGRRTALYRSACLLCGDRHEAEDLVRATLVKAVLGGRRPQRIDTIEAYARTTLVSSFVASRRRVWRRGAGVRRTAGPGRAGRQAGDADTGLMRGPWARLTPPDGRVMPVRDSTGFRGKGQPGRC